MNPEKSNRLFILAIAACLLLVGTTVFLQGQMLGKMQKSLSKIAEKIDTTAPAPAPAQERVMNPALTSNVMASVGPFELMTGSFTFKVVCDGELFVPPTGGRDSDAQKTCTGTNKLVVVRDLRLTGADTVEEKVLASLTTTADTDAVLSAEILPAHESIALLVDFHEYDPMSEGVCMPHSYNYVYDTVAPGELSVVKNYPDQVSMSSWGNGVMAYVEGCASGAAYPTESVKIYDPSQGKSIVVTEQTAVPGNLWEPSAGGYPNKGWSGAGDKGSPFWSDLKWNETQQRFEINLHLTDDRIQPIWFNMKGEDITPDVL